MKKSELALLTKTLEVLHLRIEPEAAYKLLKVISDQMIDAEQQGFDEGSAMVESIMTQRQFLEQLCD